MAFFSEKWSENTPWKQSIMLGLCKLSCCAWWGSAAVAVSLTPGTGHLTYQIWQLTHIILKYIYIYIYIGAIIRTGQEIQCLLYACGIDKQKYILLFSSSIQKIHFSPRQTAPWGNTHLRKSFIMQEAFVTRPLYQKLDKLKKDYKKILYPRILVLWIMNDLNVMPLLMGIFTKPGFARHRRLYRLRR